MLLPAFMILFAPYAILFCIFVGLDSLVISIHSDNDYKSKQLGRVAVILFVAATHPGYLDGYSRQDLY